MGNFIDSFETAFNRLTYFLISLVAISIGLIALLIPLNLLLIKSRLGAMWWLFEGVEYALYAGVFLGAPWVLQQGAHVRVDIFPTSLPGNLTHKMEQLLNIAGSILCLILFVYGLRGAMLEFEDGTLPDKSLQIYNWIILISTGLIPRRLRRVFSSLIIWKNGSCSGRISFLAFNTPPLGAGDHLFVFIFPARL